MRLQRGRILLPWLFSLVLFVEFPAMASPVYTSIQTPSSLNVLEGSTLNISCQFNRNNLSKWYIEWLHNKSGEVVELQNSRQINITVERDISLSYLVLEKADIDDSGMYQCCIGAPKNSKRCSNLTNVIIKEITDLMVNQTPADLEKTEGENVTIECYFRTVSNLSTMYVRWRKDMKDLNNQTGSVQIIQDLEKGFTSLTLTNVDKSDSGFYQCEVGSSLRNRSGLGDGSHLVVTEHNKQVDQEISGENTGNGLGPGPRPGPGFGIGAGVGAGAGMLLLLLLLSIFVWSYKKKKVKDADKENVPTKKDKKHPPLTSQMSEVTYVDLNFHRREVQPASEVIYAEVKSGAK